MLSPIILFSFYLKFVLFFQRILLTYCLTSSWFSNLISIPCLQNYQKSDSSRTKVQDAVSWY